MQTFFETHDKLRTCLRHVVTYERNHALSFDWVVRLRPDVWFFAPLPAHCTLQHGHLAFPAGVTGCGYSPCINDHLAFAPRHLASTYFDVVDDMASCDGMYDLAKHWRNYMLWRLMVRRVPLAEPSPVVPYTLLRPCANASAAAFYPECVRWTSAPPEKNAGLSHYANGSALPGADAFRRARSQHHNRCRTLAAESFPAYVAIEEAGTDSSRLKKLCAARRTGPGRGSRTG
jgi:hypothetical protein